MDVRYFVAIDRRHDGSFTDLDDDITAQVLELRWRLGLSRAYDSIADIGNAEIKVMNFHGVFSPERHRLDIGARVRIGYEAGGARHTYFTGYISHISAEGGDWGSKRAVIHLYDVQRWLEENPVRLSPMSGVTADQVIDRLLDQAILRRAVIAGYCIIDVTGYNGIDAASIFPPRNLARRLDAGKTRFAFVGDWWNDLTSIREAIGDLAESERGRFYVDREGDAVFLHRHRALVTENVSASFSDDMSGLDYAYGDQRANRVSLLMTPREQGQSGTQMWKLSQAQRIVSGKNLTLNLRFTDDRGEPLALLALDRLKATFHRDANSAGAAVTEGVSAAVVHTGFTSLQVQVRNGSSRDVFLTELEVSGKPLYRRDPLEITIADGEGMHLHGLKHLALDLPALSDIETARAFATYELVRRKHPTGAVREMRLSARDHPAAASLTLFDRIRISESQTGHLDKEYFIIGERHHVRVETGQHEVRWALEPAVLTRFVIVNDSRIDDPGEVITPY